MLFSDLLRPIADGAVHATARIRHRAHTSQVWDVELTDDHGRLCAMWRVTIAVRPRRHRSDAPA